MFIHEELLLAVLPVYKKHRKDDFQVSDLIAELNHTAWILSSFNAKGVAMLHAELKQKAQVQ
jgi:hypothetical protein